MYDHNYYKEQEHVYEITGSTRIFNKCDDCHNLLTLSANKFKIPRRKAPGYFKLFYCISYPLFTNCNS